MDEATYDVYELPLLVTGSGGFPRQHLALIQAQDWSSTMHEDPQRIVTGDDFASDSSFWYAFQRTDEDETDEDELEYIVRLAESDSDDSIEDVEISGDGADAAALSGVSASHSDMPLPRLASEVLFFDNLEAARNALSDTTSEMELPAGIEDDVEAVLDEGRRAVQELYKAICSTPVKASQARLNENDIRTIETKKFVEELQKHHDQANHRVLSTIAAMLLNAIIILHNDGYTVNMPFAHRRSDKHLTAVQRLEALLQYLTCMKGLVLKCIKEGEQGVEEVVAFPKTLFEQFLRGEAGGSGIHQQGSGLEDQTGGEEMAGRRKAVISLTILQRCLIPRTPSDGQ